MDLTHTAIVIRERSTADLFDLALPFARRCWKHLLPAAAVGIVPLAAINAWICHPLISADRVWQDTIPYLTLMGLLLFVQYPLATALVTWQLGQYTFGQRQDWQTLFRQAGPHLGPLALLHGLGRGVVPTMVLAAWMTHGDDPYPVVFYLSLLGLLIAGVRSNRPFLTEIVLLERTPWRQRGHANLNVSRRSRLLHGVAAGPLTGRFVASLCVSLLLSSSLGMAAFVAWGTFTGQWYMSWPLAVVVLPAVMWLVAIYNAVARFLGYLDVRIRQEGWELDLKLRAAAEVLAE